MYIGLNPYLDQVQAQAHQEFIKSEFQKAAEDQKFIVEKASQLLNWVKSQLAKMASGLGQGGAGSFHPSAK